MRALRSCRGSAILVCLIAIAVFALMTAVVFTAAKAQGAQALYVKRSAEAHFIAESGLEAALNSIFVNGGFTVRSSMGALNGGTYQVTVSNDTPPWVTSTGYSKPLSKLGPMVKSVKCQANLKMTPASARGYAIMTNSQANVSGVVDSYTSTVSSNPLTFASGGDVWSNASLNTAAGAVRVYGNAYYSSGGAPSASTVSGLVIQSTFTQALPNHNCNACRTTNSNLAGLSPQSVYDSKTQNVTIPLGVTATLGPGIYYFTAVDITGTLNVDTTSGTVVMYVRKNITTASPCQINNLSKYPRRFLIYGESGASAHTFNCTTPLHAKLEEPSASFTVSQIIYGRIWGKTVTVNSGAAVHGDLDLTSNLNRVEWITPYSWSESYARQ